MNLVDPMDLEVELMLERARALREPSLADKQRVLEALRMQIAGTPTTRTRRMRASGVRPLPWRAPLRNR